MPVERRGFAVSMLSQKGENRLDYLLRESGPKPEDVFSHWRQKLYQKAKQEPRFKFYTLYNHLLREDVLKEAWKRAKENDGAPGVDGITFEDIEKREGGVKRFLAEIQEELKTKTYKPSAIRRTYVPKARRISKTTRNPDNQRPSNPNSGTDNPGTNI